MTEFYDKYLKYKNKYLNLKIELAQEGGVAAAPSHPVLILYNNTTLFGQEMNKYKQTNKDNTEKYTISFDKLYGNTSTYQYKYKSTEFTPMFLTLLNKSKASTNIINDEEKLKTLFLTGNTQVKTKVNLGDQNKIQNTALITTLSNRDPIGQNKEVLTRLTENISIVQKSRKKHFNNLLTFYKTNLPCEEYATKITSNIPDLVETKDNNIKDNIIVTSSNLLLPNDMVLLKSISKNDIKRVYTFQIEQPLIDPLAAQ
jgi:hypothetical protein